MRSGNKLDWIVNWNDRVIMAAWPIFLY